MLPGDLITPRNTHKPTPSRRLGKKSHKPAVYIVRQVNKDGTVETQSLKTGRYKTIKRPEFYFVSKRAGQEAQ